MSALPVSSVHDPFTLWKGSTWLIGGTLLTDEGTPLDLTGGTLEWVLEDFDGNVIDDATIGDGITVTDLTGGLITIAVSVNVAIGRYWDKLTFTKAGVSSRLWTGMVGIQDNICILDDYDLAGLDVQSSFGISPQSPQVWPTPSELILDATEGADG